MHDEGHCGRSESSWRSTPGPHTIRTTPARRRIGKSGFWQVCERAGAALVSATEPIDTTSPTGLALVRLLVTFAGMESQVRSERLRAKYRERAERGLASHGARAFGHSPGFHSIIEPEAELLREAGRRLLAGEGISEIVADWKRRGVHGARGVPWTASGLKNTLMTPRLAGHCSYHGEVVVEDCFPTILDPLTAARVRHVLTAPTGLRVYRGALLRGLVRCGRCGGNMNRSGRSEDGSGGALSSSS